MNPFKTSEAKRLALLFSLVYFSEGASVLPSQTITIVLKDHGLTAGEVATFFSITMIPWIVKPLYGVTSDLVPLASHRRKSYFLLTPLLSALSAIFGASVAGDGYWSLAMSFAMMLLGLAFTDVVTDALMVENARVTRRSRSIARSTTSTPSLRAQQAPCPA